MLKSERAIALFDEARASYTAALEHLDEAVAELDRAELVKSVEKAWEATLQATNGLILARTGVELKLNLEDDRDAFTHLARLPDRSAASRKLMDCFSVLSQVLYITVLCEHDLEPVSVLISDIHRTADYIRDAERLAEAGPHA